MATIFVRHGLSLPDPDVPTEEWGLDPAGRPAIAALAERIPSRPVVCSSMRRAIETAEYFSAPTVDARLGEVVRPFVPDLGAAVGEYFAGRSLDGWEPRDEAVARFAASVADHGEAIYVTHGTVLSLFVAARCPGLDLLSFWTDLRSPDAWVVEEGRPRRVG